MTFQNELIRYLKAGGDNTAIERGDKSITYSQLLEQANAVTAGLLARELPPTTVVGILLEDRMDMIIAMIGTINARAAFVFLDAGLPAARMAAMQDAMRLEHVIVPGAADLPEALEGATIHVYPQLLLARPRDISYPLFSEEDSLYLYFTSGTTGTPKGIVGKNKSLLHFLQWEIAEFGIGIGSKFSQFISPYFDAFLRDVFVPLFAGGVICIPPADEDFFTAEKLTRWIDDRKISHIHCVPSLFGVINNPQLTARHFGSLEYILLSGEKINPSGLIGWYRTFGDRIQLVNLYGPTETTMIRSSYRIQPADVEKARIPVGKPIADTEFLVAGKDLKPCGISLAGDLYILTEYMTKGYLNAPLSDQQRFLDIEHEGKLRKAFRTGDKARRLPGGYFELLGREDRQIKLRGIRIELDEIEFVLHQGPGVKQAVVIQHGEDLAAFVVREEHSPARSDDPARFLAELEEYASLHLPRYMIPSSVMELKEFPLLPNGKTNYGALADTLRAAGREILSPANPTEQQLLGIWTEILGDKPISAASSFLTIGGNSLGMMRLIGKIYKQFGVRISLGQLFNNLTIQQQALLIRQSAQDNAMVIGKAAPRELYYLSAAQERIYYNYKLNTASTAYNLPMAAEIHEGDTGTIENTIDLLVRRHESLRTRFTFEGSQVFQSILEEVPFAITRLSCDDTPEAIRQTVLGFIQPFDLARPPLLRAAIVNAGEQRRLLVIDTHHIVCDGMSQVNLVSEFVQLRNGKDLPPLKIQYKDYAEWERKFKQSSDYLAHREYWLKTFEGGSPKLELPARSGEYHTTDLRGGSTSFSIDNRVMHPLNETLKANGITEFSGMFAVYFIFLSQISGQEDIVIGINTSGRFHEELMGLVGMFAKTLPVRLQLHPDASFLEFAGMAHQQLAEATSHQLYDLSDIVGDLKIRDLGASAELFSAMLVYQNFEFERKVAEGMRFSEIGIDNNTSKYPLSLYVSYGESAMQFRFEYSTRFFCADDMELLVQKFKGLVEMLSERTDQKVIDCWHREREVAALPEDVTFNF